MIRDGFFSVKNQNTNQDIGVFDNHCSFAENS